MVILFVSEKKKNLCEKYIAQICKLNKWMNEWMNKWLLKASE